MSNLAILRYMLLTATGLAMMFSLCDRRYSLKKTLAILISGFIAILLLNISVIHYAGSHFWLRLYPLITNTTSLILYYFISKNRGFFLLFNLLTAIQICGVITLPGIVLSYFGHGSILLDIVIRLIITIPAVYWLHKYFRPVCLMTYQLSKKNWGILSLMPLSFYAVFYLLLMQNGKEFIFQNILIVALTLVIMCAAYWLIFYLFSHYIQQYRLQSEQEILKISIQSFRQQVDAIRRSEEQIRLHRHDMRHYLKSIAALISGGNTDAALQAIGQYDSKLKVSHVRYCENPVLNAILSVYLQKAIEDGAAVSFKGSLPNALPCDEMALSTFFANAIENACHAIKKLPENAAKQLNILCIDGSQLVIEIANSYDGKVLFDENGHPISNTPGHGLGVKSILTFAEEHHALIDFKTDELFRLRLLLNKTSFAEQQPLMPKKI